MSKPGQLNWEDLPVGKTEMFRVWLYNGDRKWAERVWKCLSDEGLTSFSNELEQTTVLARLLALGAFYNSFCQAAWEEGAVLPRMWANDIGLTDSQVRRLAGSLGLEFDETDDLESVIQELIRHEYPAIIAALLKQTGSEEILFAFLWLSATEEYAGVLPIPDELVLEVSNEDVDEKVRAYSWMVNGSSIHWS